MGVAGNRLSDPILTGGQMPYADKTKQAEYWKRYAEKNKERIKQRKREWLAADPARQERYNAAQRARKKADPKKYRLYFRNRHLIKKYGMTEERYKEMYVKQGGVCEICGGMPDIVVHGITRLAIDHNHDTGKVRGLLCNNCNAGMGILGDSEEHLLAALAYLKKHAVKED
jgi:hypothetical protein